MTPEQYAARLLMESEAFQPGDRVTYARSFLRSTGMFTGREAFREGTVQLVKPLRQGGVVIVKVAWDGESKEDAELNPGTLSTNLVRVGEKHRELM